MENCYSLEGLPLLARVFTSVLQMCNFDTEKVKGRDIVKYPPNHQLTISFGKFVLKRMDKDNAVWDEGYFSFDLEMDQDKKNI